MTVIFLVLNQKSESSDFTIDHSFSENKMTQSSQFWNNKSLKFDTKFTDNKWLGHVKISKSHCNYNEKIALTSIKADN